LLEGKEIKMNAENVHIARIGLKQAVFVAIISGLFGLIGALIQYKVQKPTTKPQMIGFFSQKIPVGSIISSFLKPKEFTELAGDEGGFDPTSSTWVPADGRDVPGSKYSKVLTSQVPDLRGMFLRGLNYSEDGMVRADGKEDPDGSDREAGGYQADAFKSHKHKLSEYRVGAEDAGLRVAVLDPSSKKAESHTMLEGSLETRPKNIALFYYVRIN
jgi:hypothetical protein